MLLIVALAVRDRWPAVWKDLGYLVGWAAVLVGLTGVILHLQSHFFYERTLRSLTYSAPFAAPLAYTGLGFLLIMNRMVDPETLEWAQWVLLLALGGFVGNFVFSLADHAENGFFHPLEWVPVVASAFAVGFLAVPLVMRVSTAVHRIMRGHPVAGSGSGAMGLCTARRKATFMVHRSTRSIISFMGRLPWRRCFSPIFRCSV